MSMSEQQVQERLKLLMGAWRRLDDNTALMRYLSLLLVTLLFCLLSATILAPYARDNVVMFRWMLGIVFALLVLVESVVWWGKRVALRYKAEVKQLTALSQSNRTQRQTLR